MYANGEGVQQNYNEALKWYKKAADQGNIDAQYYIGMMSERMQNYSDAVIWYRKAAEQGHTFAQSNLAVLYFNGQGVKQDFSEAEKLWRMAAAKGDKDALHNLNVLITKRGGV